MVTELLDETWGWQIYLSFDQPLEGSPVDLSMKIFLAYRIAMI